MSLQDEEDVNRESDGGDDEEEPEGVREGGEGEGEIGEDDVTVGALRWAPGKIRPGRKGLKKGKQVFLINKRSKSEKRQDNTPSYSFPFYLNLYNHLSSF